MPQLTIDGRPCEYDGRKTILQVALEHDIEIPHYCYHPGMSIVASCRICLAEVAQPNPRNENKVELLPKLLPTCQTPAVDGMEVHLKSPKSIQNQKAVMEFLLINHPLDCPVCDQAGECSLQDYSFKYGRSASRFEETKIKQPKKDLGPNVLLYTDRCIMCSRCVRFTREVAGTGEIGVFGRGAGEQIDVFPGKALDNALSANVVDICPVGALLDKDFLMSMRVWNLTATPSIDGITASGDNLSIEHNEGRIYRVKPRTNLDVNQWWISDEIRYGWKFVHDDARFRTPMWKERGAQEPCDWNQAYGRIAENLRRIDEQHGEGSLAVLISPMLPCEEAYLLARLALGLDRKAVIGVGPVPVHGEDTTFPGGYTIRAEKCPNAAGVRRAISEVTNASVGFESFLAKADDARALVLTGNYPSAWVTEDLERLATGGDERFTVLIDTLPGRISDRVDVLLPGATWVEKAGTFENAGRRLQSFERAIPVIELAKNEGQIALDLMAACDLEQRRVYDAADLRREMGGAFVDEVHHPERARRAQPDMAYVAL